MGRPGSGKGTQAKLLAKNLGAEIYSSGNRLREMAKGPDFVNQKVKGSMDSGELLPAWFSSHLFIEVLLGLSPKDAVVFEGACRMLPEAHSFDEVSAWLDRQYRAVFLSISDEEVEKRLAARRGVEGRKDDASDTVERRLHEYAEKTAPAVEFFKSRGVLIEVNGEQPVDAVHQDIVNALKLP